MTRIAYVTVAMWMATACATTTSTPTEKPMMQSRGETTQETPAATGVIWENAERVTRFCDDALSRAAAQRAALKEPVKERTINNTLLGFNEMMKALDTASSWSSFLFNVHPNAEVRAAAQTCRQRASQFATEVSMDRGLYDAAAAVDVSGADDLTKRFVDHMLRDFRRAGVDKDEATRARLAEIQLELVKLSQAFGKNVKDDVKSLEVEPIQLAGLPEDFIAGHPVGANGTVTLTTDYPDFYPVQRYVEDPTVRQALYELFMNRAYPDNVPILESVLQLRHEHARILGHPHWASYNAEDKMVKNSETIEKFIAQIAEFVRPRAKEDIKELLERKKQDDRRARSIDVWDRFYYVSKVRAEKFGFDARTVRPYFPYDQVKTGILDLYGELFGLRFELLGEEPVWHPSVEAYGMYDRKGDTLLGRFYFDMHPRDGKY
ncbi:MAG: M3 family metallopeptidase, partial [Myxococcota bacterium]|nr:M3 family metallopeptidase [Myxococcota bacterium]